MLECLYTIEEQFTYPPETEFRKAEDLYEYAVDYIKNSIGRVNTLEGFSNTLRWHINEKYNINMYPEESRDLVKYLVNKNIIVFKKYNGRTRLLYTITEF